MYTIVRYKYTSCMDAQVTRKSLYIGAVAQYKVCKIVEISTIELSYTELIYLVLWKAEHLSQFSNYCFILERIVGR